MPTLAVAFAPSRSYPFPDAIPQFDFGLPAFLLLLAVFCLWRAFRHFQLRPGRRCPRCLYDMRASTSLSCSECGNTASRESQLTSRHLRVGWLVSGLLALVPPLVLLVCFLIVFVQAYFSNNDVQRAKVIDPQIGLFTSDPVVIPPPSPWILHTANLIDPNYTSTGFFSRPAACFIHLTQPLSLAVLYLRPDEVAEAYLYHPTSQSVSIAASFPTLYSLRVDGPSTGPAPKASDFYPFRLAHNLQDINIDFQDVDTAALDAVLKNKPNLTNVDLRVPSTATLVHDAFSALTYNSPNLTSLDFRSETITDADLVLLARCPRLQKLTVDDVDSQGPGIQALNSLTHLGDLRIDLKNSATVTQCVRAVSTLTSLDYLSIEVPYHAPSSPGEYAPLAALINIQQLALRQTPLSDDDLALLKPMTQLVVLELRSPRASSDGTGLNASLTGKTNLRHLGLDGFPKLRDENLRFLQTLSDLKTFSVDSMPSLTGSFLQYLPAHPIEQLEFIEFSFSTFPNIDHAKISKITFTECANLIPDVFVNLAHHPTLEKLTCERTPVSDASCLLIAQMPALREFDCNTLTPKGIESLMTSKSLKSIICRALTPEQKTSLQSLNPAITLK